VVALTALHEGLATMPDNTTDAHDIAQQLLGLTQRITGQWLTWNGLWPTRPSVTKKRIEKERI
jgi:hypothetical protein